MTSAQLQFIAAFGVRERFVLSAHSGSTVRKRFGARALLAVLLALAPSLASAEHSAARPKRTDYDVYLRPQRLVRLPDGRRLNLFCVGKGGPTVILEGGWTTETAYWRKVQWPLARDHMEVCSYDRAGYGFSDMGPMPRTASAIADDLFSMLQAARLPGPYIIVAHSLGTLDARLFAARHPDKVAALILLDPSENARAIANAVALDPRAGVEPMVAGAVACAEALSGGGSIKPTAAAIDGCASKPAPDMPDYVNSARRRMQLTSTYQQTAASELISWMGDSSRQVDAETQHLGRTPLYIVTSELSSDVEGAAPAVQAKLRALHWRYHGELAKTSTEATHTLLTNASHFIPAERPDAVIAVVRAARTRAKSMR